MNDSTSIAAILRWHTREECTFDKSNDSVVVTRALLLDAAQEIETLRNFLDGIQKMTNLALAGGQGTLPSTHSSALCNPERQ
jgi:hypothetical protein